MSREGAVPEWKKKEQHQLRRWIAKDTYKKDGALRWKSNDAVLMLSTFEEAGVEPPVAQAAEREKYVAEFTAAYRAAEAGREHSAEELVEMRSAFGAGAVVVNVLTGKKTRL